MPDTDTLEREAPPEEENQEDSPPQEESDDNQNKSQRPSLRSARRAGKLGKGFGGSGAAVGGGATAGSAGIAGGAAAGGSTAAAAGGGAAIVGGGWIILIVALVVLLILIVILIATGGGDWENQQRQNTTTPLKISKTGPSDAVKDEVLNYQINVSYAGTAQDVEVTDKIPDGTSYDKSDPSGKYDEATRTVTWNLKDYQASPGAILNNVNMAINLTLKATVDNAYLVNQASGTVIGAGTNPNGPTTEGYVPPNDNDCGEYASLISKNRFLPKNFGDPECNFDKEAVNNMLREKDSQNADWWFLVIQCESGYTPNAWLDPDTDVLGYRSPDAGGAWGLFQNGSSADFPDRLYGSTRKESVRLEEALELPGRPPPAVGHSQDPNDRGDLNWFIQVENAIKLLPERGKGYWACA